MEGHEIYNFDVFVPYRCYIPNLVKIGQVVLEKKMLMDDAWWRTPTHSNRSLSDSGDLKSLIQYHRVCTHFPPRFRRRRNLYQHTSIQSCQTDLLVVDVGQSPRHPRCEVSACQSDDQDTPTRHVLTTVVPAALKWVTIETNKKVSDKNTNLLLQTKPPIKYLQIKPSIQ